MKGRKIWTAAALAVFGVGLLGSGFLVPDAHAQIAGPIAQHVRTDKDRDQLEKERQDAERKEQRLRASLEGIESSIAQTYLDLAATREKIPAATAAANAAGEKLAAANRELEQLTSRLEIAREEMSRLKAQIEVGRQQVEDTKVLIGQIARQTYRGQGLDTTLLGVLFGATSSQDLSNRAQALSTASRSQTQILNRVSEVIAENRNFAHRQEAVVRRVGELEETARQAKMAAAEAKVEQDQHLQKLRSLEAEDSRLAASLEGQKSKVKQQIQEMQALQAAASAKIAQIDAANLAAGANRVIGSGGIFGHPVAGQLYVNSPFGARIDPIAGYNIFHYGVDLAANCGQPQFAAQSGTVISAGWDGGGGNTVYINHGMINGSSWVTVYRHFTVIQVSPGQVVSKGQQIGLTGTTGWSTGCHCHFEIWQNGAVINPLTML